MAGDATGFQVIEVQPTPNPNAMKYVLDRPISEDSLSFFNAAAANSHGLAKALFEIRGVTTLLLLGDFVTVNKLPDVKWSAITPRVKRILSAG